MGGQSKCPGETGTSRRESAVKILQVKNRCGANLNSVCQGLTAGGNAQFIAVIQNLSPTGNYSTYIHIYLFIVYLISSISFVTNKVVASYLLIDVPKLLLTYHRRRRRLYIGIHS